MVNRMETKNLQGATTPPRFKDFHELVEALKIDIPTEFGDVMTNRDGHVVKRTYLTKFTKLPKNAQPIAILETKVKELHDVYEPVVGFNVKQEVWVDKEIVYYIEVI